MLPRGLFTGLVKPNAVVRVERLVAGEDALGAGKEAWATVPGADRVPCLVGQIVASRPGDYGGQRNKLSGSLIGEHPALGMDGVRYCFLGDGGPVQEITNRYATADTITPSGPGVALIKYRWFNIQWTTTGTGTAGVDGGEVS